MTLKNILPVPSAYFIARFLMFISIIKEKGNKIDMESCFALAISNIHPRMHKLLEKGPIHLREAFSIHFPFSYLIIIKSLTYLCNN